MNVPGGATVSGIKIAIVRYGARVDVPDAVIRRVYVRGAVSRRAKHDLIERLRRNR